MEIRELTSADFFELSKIAQSISADVVEKINDDITDKKMGFQIFLSLMKTIPNEIREFIAHVTDQTVEELDSKPFNYPVLVAKALMEKEEVRSFLDEIKGLLQKKFQ